MSKYIVLLEGMIIGAIITMGFLLIYFSFINQDIVILDSEDFIKLYFKSLPPKVINGNIYIGYEEGVRIGYHQSINGTWNRCAKECRIIEDSHLLQKDKGAKK